MVDVATLTTIISGLGVKFFGGFLAGMFGGFALTRSVYISLASGGCIGALVLLMF